MNPAATLSSVSESAPSARTTPGQSATTPAQGNLILGPHMLPGTPANRVAVGPDAHLHRQPQITIHKQGEAIKYIDIQCACGEKTTIELLY